MQVHNLVAHEVVSSKEKNAAYKSTKIMSQTERKGSSFNLCWINERLIPELQCTLQERHVSEK